MPQQQNSRNSMLLKLFLYLMEETDKDHPKTRKEITGAFLKEDPNMSERYVKQCIESMQELGFPIVDMLDGHTHLYYSSFSYRLPFYQSILTLIESSKYYSRKASEALIQMICLFAPSLTEEKLKRINFFNNLTKTSNDETTYSIAAIIQAIEENRKISFRSWIPGYHRRIYKNDGNPVIVNPVGLIPDSDKLYLCCYPEDSIKDLKYRIEYLEDVTVLEEDISPIAITKRETLSQDYYGVFNMYHGTRCNDLVLQFPEKYLRSVYDKFGEDIDLKLLSIENDERILTATVSAEISPYFHWWIIEGKGQMKIVSPDWVREDQIRHIHENGLCYIKECYTNNRNERPLQAFRISYDNTIKKQSEAATPDCRKSE